jgi:hypothetical protein
VFADIRSPESVRNIEHNPSVEVNVVDPLVRKGYRLKALYRGWAIPCAGTQVYAPHYRSEWLAKIHEAGVRRRAELYYQQLDALRLRTR